MEVKNMLSRELIKAIRFSNKKQYEIAHEAGLHYSTLSRMIHGIEQIRDGDPRVLRLGAILGVSRDKLFEPKVDERKEQIADLSLKGKIIDFFSRREKFRNALT
jgi:hypothetical protein